MTSMLETHAPARLVRPRLARAHIDAMTADAETPPRALVVGSAGSGKSGTLRQLRRALADRGVDAVLAGPGVDLAGIPAADVVLVDDAHLLDDRGISALARRIDDPAAGIVVACRPWPQSDALRRLARRLEASRPAIVLGHVTAADALAPDDEHALTIECVDDLLERCGNASWLVSEALAVHDDEGCRADHDAIAEALHEVIAHRMRTVSTELREAIELLCLSADGTPADVGDDLLAAGHAEGLLQRNGRPAPIVRAAVRATVPVQRLAALWASESLDALDDDLAAHLRDPRVAVTLLAHADAALAADPRRAASLFERAAECGADPWAVRWGLARAAWATGDLDTVGTQVDALLAHGDPGMRERAAELSASMWAARGYMAHADATYRALAAGDPVRDAQALVAAVAVAGTADGHSPAARGALPSTLTVSAELLGRGLRGTLQPEYEGALGDLVRASETYSASGTADPVPELPAVIAALAALHTGELEVAAGVLDTALRNRRGGTWARPRLQLWRAWIDLQWQRPNDVESALRAAEAGGALSPRDRLLAEAIRVGLARRYSDASGLAAAWRGAQETILRTQFDLFSILPLAEFAVAAARVGDSARMHGHVARASADMARLGSPPLWAPHLHWAGIQEGILLNSPDSLRPHARELVAAAPHNPVAAAMARAGRVWTAVLGGDVDADAVEDAALGLADVGLAWDGARLAGHGAGRTDDRRINSRLLACARQLHPHEGLRDDDEGSDTEAATRPAPTLSAREREVALLVVQGMTYAEIGETIFISPRTAEHHIARIRRRLGATSRSDLIAKLRIAIEGAAASEPRRRAGKDTI